MKTSIELVKQLRDETSASVADVKNALDQAKGDMKKAKEILSKKGFETAAKRAEHTTEQGLIESYVHGNGKIGVLVELLCETDFVARTAEFVELAHEIALQVSAMDPKDVNDLMEQEYIRDESRTIGDLVREAVAKLGENIRLSRFARFEIGK